MSPQANRGDPVQLLDEELQPLALLRRHCPVSTRTGKAPHPSVLWRWCFHGLKGPGGRRVLLEHVRAGGAVCSSREALRRFFAALTEPVASNEPVAKQTDREQREISRRLVAAGLK